MEKPENFYDLEVWQCCHKLAISTYRVTTNFPREEKYSLVDQIRRAASSSSANIAEGFGRFHFKDKMRFYYQARGSIMEVQSYLILSKDLNYLDEAVFKKLWQRTKDCEKLINGLIRSTNNQLQKT